ncbi:hypothetical protein FDP41_011541 [Naegleria fowleri]|uniref:Uncharacterized protein n=1 Tax=Naegleria fowleri TaxID=5763 RepID=A0A6A5C6A1_NAEFO|nr:uncharacterized protein FDP41_011541 [Naegleria fowleri]KAF0982611.1 hypothetical protein FDP41_011541 [Naegleria fowleri]CAG4709178.1 unnamed protein product [Naegleria fowleri]
MFSLQHELNASNFQQHSPQQNTFEHSSPLESDHHRSWGSLLPKFHQENNFPDSIYLTRSYLCRMVEIACDLHETIENSLKRSEQVLEQAFIDFEQVISSSGQEKTEGRNNSSLLSDISEYMDPKKLQQRLNILAVERLKALEQIHSSFLEPLLKVISSAPPKRTVDKNNHQNLNHNPCNEQPSQSPLLFFHCPSSTNTSNLLQVPTTPVKNNRSEPVNDNMELAALQKILEHLKSKLENEKNPSQQNVLRVDIQKIEKEIFMLESGCFLSPIVKLQKSVQHQMQGKKVKPLILESSDETSSSPSTSPLDAPNVMENANVYTDKLHNQKQNDQQIVESRDHSGYWSVTSSLTENNHQGQGLADLNSQLFESMIFEDNPLFAATEQISFLSEPPAENLIPSDSDSDKEQDVLTSQFLSPRRGKIGSTETPILPQKKNVEIALQVKHISQQDNKTTEVKTPTQKQKQPDVTPSPTTRKTLTSNTPSKLPSRPNSAKKVLPLEKPKSPKNTTSHEERHRAPKSFKHMKENSKVLPNHTGLSDSIRIGIGTTEKKKAEIKPWY